MNRKVWFVNVLRETTLEHLNFTPSDECVNIQFVDKGDLQNIKAFSSVEKLAEMFRAENNAK